MNEKLEALNTLFENKIAQLASELETFKLKNPHDHREITRRVAAIVEIKSSKLKVFERLQELEGLNAVLDSVLQK